MQQQQPMQYNGYTTIKWQFRVHNNQMAPLNLRGEGVRIQEHNNQKVEYEYEGEGTRTRKNTMDDENTREGTLLSILQSYE